MYAKIIKILNALLIFIFFIVSSCSKSKPEERWYFIVSCKTSGQYDINEDINVIISLGIDRHKDPTIAYVSMINKKYVQINNCIDIYQKEEAHLIKVLDDFCSENYPVYFLKIKKGCNTETEVKCRYSFDYYIPKELLEDNEGVICIFVTLPSSAYSLFTLKYEIIDETVKFNH